MLLQIAAIRAATIRRAQPGATMKSTIKIILCVVVLCSACLVAAIWFLKDRISIAMAETQKDAENGDAKAQEVVGDAYMVGMAGLPKDETKAVFWLRKAAEQNNADAQEALASLYWRGGGVAKDEAQAAAWFRKAGEQGNADAQQYLALMYMKGQGVPKDDVQAFSWFLRSANGGSAWSQNMVGMLYEDGLGVAKDEVQASLWYRRAADSGNADAEDNIERLSTEAKTEPAAR